MRNFSTNLTGKVRNFSLPKNRPLIPLYEAIVNSINSIEEREKAEPSFKNGKITINVLRDRTLFSDSDKNTILGFSIVDNGAGFNDDNMASFMEADSEYKADMGGKGVGRFSWLKAFSEVNVKSVYYDGNEYLSRSFTFSLDNPGIDDVLISEKDAVDNTTTITLKSYLKEYEQNVPKQLEIISTRIIQHCLVYLLDEKCPTINLCDDESTINLNKTFSHDFITDDNTSSFTIQDHKFDLLNIKIQDHSFNNKNRLYLCANGRLVDSKIIENYIVNLDEQIYERQGYWYLGVLTSEFFDSHVDMNRLSFNIQKESNPLIQEPSMNEIIETACHEIEKYLDEYLNNIRQEKEKRVESFTINEAPQYRHLLNYMPDRIAAIKPGISDEKLDDELYGLKREFENSTKKECNGLG